MAVSFNTSGRIDSFEFVICSSKNLGDKIGNLEGVVGGTLSFGYYTDLQVSGQLKVVNVSPELLTSENYIQIYYCCTIDGQEHKRLLGTFMYTAALRYENGIYKGTLNLRSLLARYIDDVTSKKWTLKQGETVQEMYKHVFQYHGGFPQITGVKNAKLTKTYVFDAGVSPMKILQYIADFAGGEIVVDENGRTVLQKYNTPGVKAKNITHTIKADANSVILPGVEMSNTLKEVPNKVVCVFNKTEDDYTFTYVGSAVLDESDPHSKQNIDRYITKFYALNNCKKPYQKTLEDMAVKYLKKLNHNYTYYEFDCYFQPIHIGEVIYLEYDNIKVKGLITDIDMDLALGGKMHVKIRKV